MSAWYRLIPALAALLTAAAAAQAPAPPPAQPAAPPARPASEPGPARSPRNANYTITARLDPASRTLRGDGLIAWRNISSATANSLRLHLYYNAWRNSASSWMRERQLAGNTELAGRPPDDWGWTDITGLRLIGADGVPRDLTAQLRYIAPDDGNERDRTLIEVPLESPVPPGGTATLQIAWSARVPRTFARTGTIGDFFFLAHWFPKIGVLEDAGWNAHQFHSATEFFADFGVYDVRLTVPDGWIVGATGVERTRPRSEGDGTTTHHYYAEDVHDFAWTTSPDFVEHTAVFEHPTLPRVTMRLLLQPEHAGQEGRHFEATRAALRYYGEWYGAYPYGYVTIVDPAWQSGAGGMEYPTLFTAGTRWLAPRQVSQPESVTVHEAGHQFWYGIVATNEFEHAWMDEGFNTFSTARTLEQFFTPHYAKRYFGGFIPWVFEDLPLSRATDGNRLTGYRPNARSDVPDTATWRYWPGTAGSISYNKTALWLHTLERMLGWDTLQRILSTYFTRYAFKHPKPADFFAVASEVAGQDLTWFFDEVHSSAHAFDYGIEVFTSERPRVRGYSGNAEERAFADTTADDRYRTTVVARRHAEGVFPVDVAVRLENGEEIRWRWDGRDTWKRFETETAARAVSAQVDPDRVLLLDLNYTNNSMTLGPRAGEAARKWSLAWLIWLQDQLLTYGFFV